MSPSQLTFCEQAFRPVPQEIHSLWNRPESLFLKMVRTGFPAGSTRNPLFVEQAREPVAENGARFQLLPNIISQGD
ncbi:MAG: hypothetical protein EAZ60_02415 [Oscillatoriales cyanobacterium]|nr:hypothetical protein [Microcoleus sp. PH2017_27_LUM_O_A]TAE81406.1 MAG: hypothetical protein EAZ83_15075 [Oscillatoriales cyanobacterium]TAE94317.1 MAG: hypothetical protein EAZ79_23780 [Oscillatoriales cyanobacterium]TAF18855.1 MAG: hypothetical protein EAZ73_17245 [Oscillatoriales cyanobacterium]TAF28232.1 MAG: hypothetical protein EAZ69_27170 [Oscillatoriales cyanobacterium]